MELVIFICHGNICRSVAAEYIAKTLDTSNRYQYISRAVSNEESGNDIYPPMKRVLAYHDIHYSRHYASRISLDEFKNAKYILCMDYSNISYLKRMFHNEDFTKVTLLGNLEIEDPWYTDRYEKVFNEIKTSIIHFLSEKSL